LNESNKLYVRAKPKNIKFVETYFYQRECSSNASIVEDKHSKPIEQIKIVLPYDGFQFFTQQACNDVKTQLKYKYKEVDGLIGHIAFANSESVDMQKIPLTNFRTLPIEVPIINNDINIDELQTDQNICIATHEYMPQNPKVLPVNVNMTLCDEDILSEKHADA